MAGLRGAVLPQESAAAGQDPAVASPTIRPKETGEFARSKVDMSQQHQGQGAPADDNGDSPSLPPPRNDNDDTWGLGSASALDSLRRQNFRGRRSHNHEERPAAE